MESECELIEPRRDAAFIAKNGDASSEEQTSLIDNHSSLKATQTRKASNSREERTVGERQSLLDCPCCRQLLRVELFHENGQQKVTLTAVNDNSDLNGFEESVPRLKPLNQCSWLTIESQTSVPENSKVASGSECVENTASSGNSNSLSQPDRSLSDLLIAQLPNDITISQVVPESGIPTLKSTNSKTSVKRISKPAAKVTTIMISTQKPPSKMLEETECDVKQQKWSKRSPSQVIALPNPSNCSPFNLCIANNGSVINSPVSLYCSYKDCNKVFTESFQFNLHMKQHSGEKVYICNWIECERLFSTKQRLNDHIRNQHTGERPFECEYCSKAFTSTKNLRAHRLLHTGERPYKCDWDGCDARFRRSHHLTAHRRIHTGERPFACPHLGCTLAFTKSDHAKRHYLTHFRKAAKAAAEEKRRPTVASSGEAKSDEEKEIIVPSFDVVFDEMIDEPIDDGRERTEEENYISGVEAIVMLDEKEGILKQVDNGECFD